MGDLAIADAELVRRYGSLGERFNTLRSFYNCVRDAMNTNTSWKGCV